jgi:acyl-CoA synthetase (AMP-forming)/AMP-acid ligase II
MRSTQSHDSFTTCLHDLGLPTPRVLACDEAGSLTVGEILRSQIDLPSAGAASGVALCLTSVLQFIRAIAALDGKFENLLLLSPELPPALIQDLMAQTDTKLLISDRPDLKALAKAPNVFTHGEIRPPCRQTKWLLTTSGTTSRPKIVGHNLESLTQSVRRSRPDQNPIWGLLYEASRFAGLQVLLQSLLGGGQLVAPSTLLSLEDRIHLLASKRCSHLSATPTQWRRILMSPHASKLPLRQITLGGENCDGRILSALSARYPAARITTIYASTEVGVVFSSSDQKPGFPADVIDARNSSLAYKIEDGMLWVKPPGQRVFISTGDMAEIIDDRIYVRGRLDNTANIGGTKICI